MKLLIVTNLFPFPDDPTRGVFNASQIRALPASAEVSVLVPVPFAAWRSRYRQVRQWENCRLRYVPFFYPPGVAHSLHGVALWLSLQVGARRWIRATAPDVVLGSFLYPDGWAAARIAAGLGVPLVLKAHGSDVNQKAQRADLRPRIQYALRRAARLVVVSSSLQHELERLGYQTGAVRVIRNGVDTAAFAPRDRADSRASLGLPGAGSLALFAGNLKESKGAVDAVAAICALAESGHRCRLVIVGDGTAAAAMRRLAQQRGVQDLLLWRGRRQHAELASYMNAADLLLLPSHAEGIPNVVLEALACGTPVVATAVGGIPEILPAAAGVLVTPGHIAGLAAAMATVLAGGYDRQAIRGLVEQRSWAASAARLDEVLHEAIAGVRAADAGG